jgi:hypothetical protein
MSGPRVYDGKGWIDVKERSHTGNQAPVPPVLHGDGKTFVSIPNYRGKFAYRRQGVVFVSLYSCAGRKEGPIITHILMCLGLPHY